MGRDRVRALFVMILCGVLGSACAKKSISPGLVSTAVLGSQRGLHFVRAITHFHTPYSFDACDGKGINADGTINRSCLHDAKYAFCENHINYIFASDHVSHLAETSFTDLALIESGDTLITNGAGDPIGNQIGCSNGFAPVLAIGLEGKLLGLGMENHVAGTISDRETIYGGDDLASRDALQGSDPGQSHALIGIPHTESRDLLSLIALQPKFIEIYNLHANLDPKIRKKYLHRNPFDKVGVFINYLVDPYNSLNPDYMFMDFIEFNSIYFQTWDAMISAGLAVTGVGGLDSHENIFSQKGSDGQRLDHHRRMTRYINNFVLTPTDSLSAVKSAIAAGQVYFVVEGLGTPVGLDFHGTTNGTITEMGGTMTVSGANSSSLEFTVPSVYSEFPGMNEDEKPEMGAEVIYVNGSGVETVLARSNGSLLTVSDPPAGNYRIRVWIRPRHLREFLFQEDQADEIYTWIISNHIRVSRI